MFGWQARRFHYMKNPKALADYLKPALTPEEKRATGAAKARALFERKFKEKKGGG